MEKIYIYIYIYIHTIFVTTLCPTLCHPVNCSPPGSSVHGISQARILEWAAISFQGIFLTQGLNLSPAWQADSSPLSHQGSLLCIYIYVYIRAAFLFLKLGVNQA